MKQSQRFLSAENKIKNEVISPQISTLKVACSPIIFKSFIFPILADCLKSKVNVSANSLLSDKDKVFFVKEDLLDFCVIKDYGIPIDLNLYVKKISTLHYVFFYNPNNFKISGMEDIKKHPLILKSSDTKGRKDFDKLFSDIAKNCSQKIEVSHDELVITAAESGLGVGFAPKEYISPQMQTIVPDKSYTKDILLIYKNNSPILENFLKATEKFNY